MCPRDQDGIPAVCTTLSGILDQHAAVDPLPKPSLSLSLSLSQMRARAHTHTHLHAWGQPVFKKHEDRLDALCAAVASHGYRLQAEAKQASSYFRSQVEVCIALTFSLNGVSLWHRPTPTRNPPRRRDKRIVLRVRTSLPVAGR